MEYAKLKKPLTEPAKTILDNYRQTGEDDMFYLGQIAQGSTSATLPELIHRAQVFTNPKFLRDTGSRKGYTSAGMQVVAGVVDGSIKGVVNDGFTSFVVADTKPGLSNLSESYYAQNSSPFFRLSVTADISGIEDKLSEYAKTISVLVKKHRYSIPKEQPATISKISSNNALCVLMDEIYQVVDQKNTQSFDSDLEKATANILATWLVSRAMNLSVGNDDQLEQKLDEAMKLQFYTHLNGCFNKGSFSISKIIRNGVEMGMQLINDLGYGEKDIQDKYERLGTPLKQAPSSVADALFGAKKVEEPVVINEQTEEQTEDQNVDTNEQNTQQQAWDLDFFRSIFGDQGEEQPNEQPDEHLNEQPDAQLDEQQPNPIAVLSGAVQSNVPPVIYLPGKTLQEVPANTKFVDKNAKVLGEDEKAVDKNAKVLGEDEKAVDKNAQILGEDEKAVPEQARVWDPTGSVVSFEKLKKAVVTSILTRIEEKQNENMGNPIGLFYRGVAICVIKFFNLKNKGGTELPKDRKSKEYVRSGMNYGESVCQNLDWAIQNVYEQRKVQNALNAIGNSTTATRYFKNQVAKEYFQDELKNGQKQKEQDWETFARKVVEDAGKNSGLMNDKNNGENQR